MDVEKLNKALTKGLSVSFLVLFSLVFFYVVN